MQKKKKKKKKKKRRKCDRPGFLAKDESEEPGVEENSKKLTTSNDTKAILQAIHRKKPQHCIRKKGNPKG